LLSAVGFRLPVREFYFSSGNYSGSEMAAMLIAALPEMSKVCRKHDAFHRQHY